MRDADVGACGDGGVAILASDAGGCGVGAAVSVAAGFGAGAVFAGAGFFINSGNSFGAMSAQPHRRAIETSTATKILFSIYGTGSQPPGLKTWQRDKRRIPSQTPRGTPYFSIACIMYIEHVGSKRHIGGSIGEMNRL